MFYNSFINIAVIIIYIAVGYFCGYKRYIDFQVNEGINKIIFNITLPCMVITSFKQEYNTPFIYKDMLVLFILYVIFKTIWLLASIVIFKKSKDEFFSSNRYSMLFSNCGYMGMPMTQAILGERALIYASIYVIIFNIFSNSLGVMLYKGIGKLNIKELIKVLINPTIISAFIGIIFFGLKITFPPVMLKPMTSLGNMTTPLSFITLGYALSKSSFKELFKGKIQYITCALKLIVVPISAIIIFKPFMDKNLIFNTFVILEAMPVAASAIIYANSFKNLELQYASKITFLSTLLSLVTIPFIVLVINLWP